MAATDEWSWVEVGRRHRALVTQSVPVLRPVLLGHVGDRGTVQVVLRPFADGLHHLPIVEAMAMAVALSCDRVSLALPGRAWDPKIAAGSGHGGPAMSTGTPTTVAATTVLAETRVVAGRGGVDVAALLHPVRRAGALVEFGPAVALPRVEGWIPNTMAAILTRCGDAPASPDVGRIRACLDALGHHVTVTA